MRQPTVSQSHVEEEKVMKMYEEERRLMILRQLEILTNKKMMENADVDHSIHLLQVNSCITGNINLQLSSNTGTA